MRHLILRTAFATLLLVAASAVVGQTPGQGGISNPRPLTGSAVTGALGYTPARAGANNDITSLLGLSSPISGALGGTGVANTGKTITLGGNLVTSGNHTTTITTLGATAITLPLSGTLLTTTGNGSSLTGLTASQISSGTLAVGVGGTGTTTATGTGSVVRATSPTLVTPALGAATGTSLALGGATLGSQALAVTGTSAFSDSVGVGTTSLTGYSLRVGKGISGATDAFGIASIAEVQSGVTGSGFGFYSALSSAATSFTTQFRHYVAAQGTVGAGSTVSNQYGFLAESSLTGASNNYGFYGNLAASGTSRYNLYMAGSAPNYLSGPLGIGSTNPTGSNVASLQMGRNLTGATSIYGALYNGTVQSDVTNAARIFATNPFTQAASFTLSNLRHFEAGQGAFGAGSTVTNQAGFFVDSSLVGATNNYAFYGNIPSGSNRWNAYMGGTAPNWFAGPVHAGNTILLYGASSGTTTLAANGAAAGTITVPNGTDVLVARNTTDTLTNKTLTAPAINGAAINSTTTGVTQSAGTNNTTLATTAYVDSAVSSSGAVPTGTIMPYAGFTAPGGYFFANGQAVSRSTYAALFNTLTSSATVTITIASPGVVTWTSHGFIPGMPVVFTTTGALPTGITAGTVYYVGTVATNTFEVSATLGGAAINTSGSQSGTHTARAFPYGIGDGSTTFNLPDFRGRAPFGVDNMGGVANANRLGSNSSVGGIALNAILGTTGGAQTHVQTVAELAPHTHAVPNGMVGGIDVGGTGAYLSAGLPNNGTSGSTGTASPMNITPPALVVNYIIRQRRRPVNDNHRPAFRRRRHRPRLAA